VVAGGAAVDSRQKRAARIGSRQLGSTPRAAIDDRNRMRIHDPELCNFGV